MGIVSEIAKANDFTTLEVPAGVFTAGRCLVLKSNEDLIVKYVANTPLTIAAGTLQIINEHLESVAVEIREVPDAEPAIQAD